MILLCPHLEQLETLLVPTKTTKTSLWVLQQDALYAKEAQTGESVASKLLRELEITTDQLKQFQQHKQQIQSLTTDLRVHKLMKRY